MSDLASSVPEGLRDKQREIHDYMMEQAEKDYDRKTKAQQERLSNQGCQMAKFDPFLSLDCAWVEGVGAQSKERKG